MKLPIVITKLADPKTCWWSNVKSKNGNRQRKDILLGFTRTFMRDHGVYIYRFTCGRFTIGIMFT